MNRVADKWFLNTKREENAAVKLIMFPHAGGNAMYYLPMEMYSSGTYKLMCVNLPGRDIRSEIPMYSSLRKLAQDFIDENKDFFSVSQNYILMGHSMGAIIAYEAASYIEELGLYKPLRLIVSGAVSPKDCEVSFRDAPDNGWDIERYLLSLGGMSNQMLENEEFRSYYMPIIINDFKACGGYVYEKRPKLSIPVNVFYGFNDDSNDSRLYTNWKEYTSSVCSETGFEGGHFFIHDSISEVCKKIVELAQKG